MANRHKKVIIGERFARQGIYTRVVLSRNMENQRIEFGKFLNLANLARRERWLYKNVLKWFMIGANSSRGSVKVISLASAG